MNINRLFVTAILSLFIPIALAVPPETANNDFEVSITNTPEVEIAGTPEFTIIGTTEVSLAPDQIFTIGGTTDVVITEPAEVVVTETANVNVLNDHRVQVQYLYFADRGGNADIVFTVPEGKKITITDFIIHHASSTNGTLSGANFARLNADGSIDDVFSVFVREQENEIVNLRTGFEFFPGDRLSFTTGGNLGVAARVQGMAIGYMADL